MKRCYFFIPVFCLLFVACEKEDLAGSQELVGTWRLVEVLADPGDGSGTFESVNSDRRITFRADGTYTSAGNICSFNTNGDEDGSGQYFPAANRLEPAGCFTTGGSPITFEQQGPALIISYLCIEPCQHKYRKE